MSSMVLANAIQAVERASAVKRAREIGSLQELSRTVSAEGQIDRYTKELSRAAMSSGVTTRLDSLKRELTPSIVLEKQAQNVVDQVSRARRELEPDRVPTYAEITGETALRSARKALMTDARAAATRIHEAIGPDAFLGGQTSPLGSGSVPETDVWSALGPDEFAGMRKTLNGPCNEPIVYIPPVAIDAPCTLTRQPDLVPASDLTKVQRSAVAHRYVYVLERALRRFICERMLEAFGDNWLREGVPDHRREKWKRARKRDGVGASRRHLTEFADFGEYAKIITEDDDVWSRAFESVLHDKEAIIHLLGSLNRYRRDISHSRGLSPDELVAFHYDVVSLLSFLAPEAVDELPGSILFGK